jgi:hypothetical protein
MAQTKQMDASVASAASNQSTAIRMNPSSARSPRSRAWPVDRVMVVEPRWLGPQALTVAPARLEIVRIAEIEDGRGFAIVLARRPFAPSPAGIAPAGFEDPVVLVRAPFRVSFAYAGADRTWRDAWEGTSGCRTSCA